jgi:UDP-N-acetylglucosamine 4,6-dehydratase
MKNILVTGGSGFFGRGFIRKALDMGAERVCVFSRGEYAQAQMRQEFDDDRLRFFVGDVRDRDRLTRAMEGVSLVIHAAALKRVEVGEYDASEMVKTNVLGAMNVIEAATDACVSKVVALSSDKAFAAANCYGATKFTAEKLFLAANNARGKYGPIYAVTRYGNVSGSTGSVIPTWRREKEAGRPVRLTNPEATRFWMTLDQAVDLVIRTAETMTGGELAIPRLPAYRLGDLAEAMALDFNVTGLGDGEKLHESMTDGESSDRARRMSVPELEEALQHVAA